MIRHVVFYTYKDSCTKEEIEKVYNNLDAISARLPGRIGYTWGPNTSHEGRNQGYTHCLVADFKDAAARDLFIEDPARVELAVKQVLPRMTNGVDSIISFDFEWHD